MNKLTIKQLVEQFADLDKMLKENEWQAIGSYEICTSIDGYKVILTISSEEEDEE